MNYLPIDSKCKKLAITSAVQEEGKSLAAINVSIALAQSNKKVLLIDADMRRPKLGGLLKVSTENGLSEYLAGIDDTPNILKCDVKNLNLFCSGRIPPNPTEMLSLNRFNTLVDMISKYYDYLIIDTPPLGIVTDSSIIASIVDGYLISVRAEYSDVNEIKEVVESLEQVNAKIFGFLMNGIEVKNNRKYNSYYNKSYDC